MRVRGRVKFNHLKVKVKVQFAEFGLSSPQSQPMESAPKRRRVQQRSQSPNYELNDQDDSYEPYVPVAQRREAKLAKLTSWGATVDKERAKKQLEELEERKDEEEEEAKRKEMARKERTLLMEAQDVHSKKAEEGKFDPLVCFLILTLQFRCEKD